MRNAVLVGIFLALSGCSVIPVERVQEYSGAYADMKRAAESIYTSHVALEAEERRANRESRLASAQGIDYFNLVVPETLDSSNASASESSNPQSTNALAALDAGSLYNEALLGLAAGKSVEDVQSSVAAVGSAISSLGGAPWIGQVMGIIAGQVEKARARKELLEALTRQYTISVSANDTRTGHLIQLLLDLLARDAELMFLDRRVVEEQRVDDLHAENRVIEARIAADAMAEEAKSFVAYRELLDMTKAYFGQLEAAAANPESDDQALSTALIAREVVSQARLVVALIRGR